MVHQRHGEGAAVYGARLTLECCAASILPTDRVQPPPHNCGVCVLPSADVKVTDDEVSYVIHSLSSLSPDAPSFILHDFSKSRMNRILPNFKLYVTCPTHGEQTTDLCYGNINGAFQLRPLPGLGRSDHSTVELTPVYRTTLKRRTPRLPAVYLQ